MKYELENRCTKFGEDVILFLKKIPKDDINRPLIKQLVRSSTSIGANYMEANEAISKKDFKNKVAIAKKEAGETKHWLRIIGTANPTHIEQSRKLWQEAQELTLILAKIIQNTDKK